MKQTDPQFKLRIPPDLKADLSESAIEHGRSMNAEIVARLEESFVDKPVMTEEIETELNQYRFFFKALKATSDDFDEELKERMSKYMATVKIEIPEIGEGKGVDRLRALLGAPPRKK